MGATILQDRLERLLSSDVHLRSGAGQGANGEIDVCVMQAVDWLAGGDGKTDSPSCAARSITRFCIRLNDSPLFKEHRDLLKPYAAKIVGTRTTWQDEVQRAYVASDFAVRIAAPLWLRALAGIVAKDELKAKLEAWATICETLAPIRDSASAKAARVAANEVRKRAWDICRDAVAVAVADADADAVAVADAAADAAAVAAAAAVAVADAAADAVAVAAAAADAAAVAVAVAVAARRKVFATHHGDALRAKSLECLDAMIAVGKVAA